MSYPLILQLSNGGEPSRWIDHERAAFYFAKDLVLWTHGAYEYTLRGGKSRLTGEQSVMVLPSIVAIKVTGNKTGHRPYKIPTLNNKSLFRRDHCVCAYCGGTFDPGLLTRDHIIPVSFPDGLDKWTNVVTACGPCNWEKDDRTPEQANMPLLYKPYAPTQAEYLILKNKGILPEQLEFLMRSVGSNSRLLDKKFLETHTINQGKLNEHR